MNKKILLTLALLLILGQIVQAATGKEPGITNKGGDLISIVSWFFNNLFLTIIWIIAAAFSVIMFVLAGFKFLTAQGNPQETAEARRAVIWGLAGVAVIVLAWSIIGLVKNELGT